MWVLLHPRGVGPEPSGSPSGCAGQASSWGKAAWGLPFLWSRFPILSLLVPATGRPCFLTLQQGSAKGWAPTPAPSLSFPGPLPPAAHSRFPAALESTEAPPISPAGSVSLGDILRVWPMSLRARAAGCVTCVTSGRTPGLSAPGAPGFCVPQGRAVLEARAGQVPGLRGMWSAPNVPRPQSTPCWALLGCPCPEATVGH